MNKLNELTRIIYDYDNFISYWFDGLQTELYETNEGKSAYEVADELRNKAIKIIEELKVDINKSRGV